MSVQRGWLQPRSPPYCVLKRVGKRPCNATVSALRSPACADAAATALLSCSRPARPPPSRIAVRRLKQRQRARLQSLQAVDELVRDVGELRGRACVGCCRML